MSKVKKNMKAYCIILDWDGVIANSLHAQFDWFRHICTQFKKNFPYKNQEDFRADSRRTSIIQTYIALRFDWEKDKCAIWEEYKKYPHSQPILFDNIETTLHSLHQEFSLSIASSSKPEKILSKLDELRLTSLFDSIITCYDVPEIDGHPPLKPDPSILIHTLQKIRCSPRNAAYIGDEPGDIEASRRVAEVLEHRMYSLASTYGYTTREILAHARPDGFVDHHTQIAREVRRVFSI